MQRRRGPNTVGIHGLLQALADGFKSISKETIIPSSSNYIIFILSPLLILTPSLLGRSVIPIDKNTVIADANPGLLVILAIPSLSVYGIILSGWSSIQNTHS